MLRSKKTLLLSVFLVVPLLILMRDLLGRGLHQGSAGRAPAVTREVTDEGEIAVIDWTGIHERIREKALELGQTEEDLRKLRVSVYVNGVEEIKDLPWERTRARWTEPPHRQMDYYVVHKRAGEIVDISEFSLKESKDGQNVTADSFSGLYAGELFGFELAGPLAETLSVSPRLTRTAVRLGYKKVVWVLSPAAAPAVGEFIARARRQVDVRAQFAKNGRPERVTVTDRGSGRAIDAAPSDFFFKVDAAFSANAFFWDDMLVALATVPYHPWLAESTVRFWLMVQDRHDGLIPREVRKENLSLWFPNVIRYGEPARTNLTNTNPFLMNWVMDELWRFNPSEDNRQLLEEVTRATGLYALWMETHRAVRDRNGGVIGFNGSALGSGADNARGGIGNRNEEAAHRSSLVDFLSQQITMYSDLAKWRAILGQKNKAAAAQAQAALYAEIMNRDHWSEELAFFVDLVPDESGRLAQNTNYLPVTGFWPLFTGRADRAKTERIAQAQLRPEAFGGDFPLPANARHTIRRDAPVEYVPREPFEDEDGYWDKWAHWPSMAMIAIEGFHRSGRPDLAHRLTKDYLAKMAEWSTDTVEESYGEIRIELADGGVSFKSRAIQHSRHAHRPDFAGWGKGPPISLLLKHVLGLSPQYDGVLEWNLFLPMDAGDRLTVNNLQYLGGTVASLSLEKNADGGFTVTAVSEKPLRLRVNSFVDAEDRLRPEVQGRSGVFPLEGSSRERKHRVQLGR